jgi:hypothetical protein
MRLVTHVYFNSAAMGHILISYGHYANIMDTQTYYMEVTIQGPEIMITSSKYTKLLGSPLFFVCVM